MRHRAAKDRSAVLLEDPDGTEKLIRAIANLRDKHPRSKVISQVLGYLRSNRHRMRYAQRELDLTLSEEKTLITPVTSTMPFLGHHLRVRRHPGSGRLVPHAVIPKERSKQLRRTIKALFSWATTNSTLAERLKLLNPVLRGWANFYKHAWEAKRVLRFTDHYVWWTIYRWLRKKHPKTPMRELYKQYAWRKPRGRMLRWRDGETYPHIAANLRVQPYRLAWQRTPDFASTSMESPVRIERRSPGSVRGVRKPARGKPAISPTKLE